MTIDAVLTPAEIAHLPSQDLSRTVCVVFDVLRATSSMLTGLSCGVAEIAPVLSAEEAFARRAAWPDALLGGERHGDRLDGFDLGNSPLEYRDLAGRRIISTTTNGTVALRACAAAGTTLLGAILNLASLVEAVRQLSPERLLLVCAGTFETFALEDAWAAGRLVALLGERELTDAAQAVLAVVQATPDPQVALRQARNGRVLIAKGREAEVEWCAQESRLEINSALTGGVIRRWAANPLVQPPFSA